MTTPIHREALRFLVAGAINTATTYAIYLVLLPWLQYVLAYTIAYVAGIALAYALSTWYVFRVRRSTRGMLLFPLVYVVQYLLGVGMLQLAVSILAIPQKYALLVSIAVTVPVTFVLTRLVLTLRAPPISKGNG
jgi:putative flippase GtrA